MAARRNLTLLWIGQFVGNLGDQIFAVLVTFLILTLEADADPARKAGIVQFMNYLPHLLFGVLAGTLVDRMDRRRTMILTDIARAVVVLGIPVAFTAGSLSWITVAAVAFGLTTFATLFNPARDAFIPVVAEDIPLVRANALFQTSILLAMVIGALVAGGLVSTDMGLPGDAGGNGGAGRIVSVLWLNCAFFLVSGLMIFLIRPRRRGDSREEDAAAPRPSTWHDLVDGLRYVARDPLIPPLLIVTAVDNFFLMGPAILGANLLAKETYGMGPAGYAFMETALATGWLIGTLVIARWGKDLPKGRLILTGMILDGLTYIPIAFIRSYGVLLAAILFHGLFIPCIVVGRTALIQQEVPTKRLGRIFALINLTFIGFTGLSMIATGEAAQAGLTPPQIFLVGGAFAALCGAIGFTARPLRRAR